MNALVDSAIRIPAGELKPKVEAQIWTQLRFANPEFQSRLRFGRSTKGIPRHIELIECDPQTGALVVPRGAVGIVRRAAEECGELVKFEDRRWSARR